MAFSARFFHISVAIADVAEVAGDSVPVIADGGDHRKKSPELLSIHGFFSGSFVTLSPGI